MEKGEIRILVDTVLDICVVKNPEYSFQFYCPICLNKINHVGDVDMEDITHADSCAYRIAKEFIEKNQ